MAQVANSFFADDERVAPRLTTESYHRAVADIREHLERCVDDLRNVECGRRSPKSATCGDSERISPITIRTLAACVSEMLKLEAAGLPREHRPDLCKLLDCPQQPILRKAIQETVAVLEGTKSLFKSKQLGMLRAKLERLLENEGRYVDTA